MSSRSDQLALSLNAQRSAFKAFLVARVGNEADAEDILQNGILKALQRGEDLQDDAKLEAWFYRLLRNAIIDFYRTRAATRRWNEVLASSVDALDEHVNNAPPGWSAQLCGCLAGVAATLKPQQAELIRLVDLNGVPVQSAAASLGLSANNASVILHRARRNLREKLEAFCGACAEGACLDCECESVKKGN